MAAVHGLGASLRIAGDSLRVAEITRLMGRQPSLSCEKGGPAEGRGRADTGLWLIRATGDPPERIDAQIMELLRSVDASPETWQRLRSEFKVDVYCRVPLGEG